VLLKRGFSATVDELLQAAEYVLSGGNHRVILCERGIRTFETAYRFTLDVGAVAVLRERTRLPVVVDPSHAAGRRRLVLPLSLAALAAGADGLLVEVHPAPREALCDGEQALTVDGFEPYLQHVGRLARFMGRRWDEAARPIVAAVPASMPATRQAR
jgi:3-deoxy-7-phosphoheptulonate synthase